jgi:TatD DNase family protein
VYRNGAEECNEDCQGLVDTHCHLDLEPLRSQLPDLLDKARRAGVTDFVVPGVHPDEWEQLLNLTRHYTGLYPAFGIHPMHAATAGLEMLSRLTEYADMGVAIGEIGLDPYCPVSMERQEQAFRDQLRLAVTCGLPVLVHCRKAFQKTLQVLQEERACQVGGIMHAFSGSPEMAREFIRLGFDISWSGTLTWRGAVRPVRLARELPLENLVLETDAPDLAPHPLCGEPNHPARLVEILAAVARIRGIPVAQVARAAGATSRRVLRL